MTIKETGVRRETGGDNNRFDQIPDSLENTNLFLAWLHVNKINTYISSPSNSSSKAVMETRMDIVSMELFYKA